MRWSSRKLATALLPAVAAAFGLAASWPADDPRSGVDPAGFDKAVRAQDDLFRHVNGTWLKTREIPADRSADGAFYGLRDKSEADIRAIIEGLGAQASKSAEAQKVADLFASFMNEERADELALKPVAEALAKIDAIGSREDLVRTIGWLQRGGVTGPFYVHVETDAKKSDRYIIYLGQSGIGLPDESYYREAKFAPILAQYKEHVGRIFELAGKPEPKEAAARVVEFEARLAKSHWDNVKNRDEDLTYNKKTIEELVALTPGFDWQAYSEGIEGPQGVSEVVVRQPDYLTAMAGAVAEVPLSNWKEWLTWQVLRSAAPLLSKPFVDENFAFYGKVLTGAPENRPRWKRGVMVAEMAMGEALGKIYVEKHFPPAAKARMKELVQNLIEAYREGIQGLEWMSPETKKKALDKLATFNPKIGYPDKWRDYSALKVDPNDLVGNMRRAYAFELNRQFNKLGKPVDRDEWGMTPQTVNAYYNPGMNEIVFPAAILQPPFFDLNADDAVNYGGIGAVIGHEIGHGFDDQGSKYDGDGNLKNWWTDADRAEFDKRAKKLIEQYSNFEPAQLPGNKVNGALTIGENIGDLGGLTIAYKAYKLARKGKEAPKIDGLTGEQRLFIGWAQVWRTKMRDAELSRRLATDPHSPAEFRCNGIVRNLPEFYEAFGVKQGDKLWLPADQRVKIW
ncbi:MAG: M13 family metallopeptidase [Isosphaeraceae bacterium]